jgi:hypothetical protein
MTEKNKLQEYCQKHKLQMPIYKSWSSGQNHQLEWNASVSVILANNEIITKGTIVSTASKGSAEKQAARILLDSIKSRKQSVHRESLLNKLSHTSDFMEPTKISIKSTHQPHSKETNQNIQLNQNLISPSEIELMSEEDDTVETIPEDNFDESQLETVYLIDLENKPHFKMNAKQQCIYIGFLNSIHHSVDKYANWHQTTSDNIKKEIDTSKNNKLLYLIDGGTPDLVDHMMTAFIYPLIYYLRFIGKQPEVKIISGDHAGWCTRACLEKILKWYDLTNVRIKNTIKVDK